MKKKIFLFIGIILILTIILVFVFQRTKNSESLEDTSLRLKWICQAQFAGYYTANAEGYYKDEGLNVTIDPAGPNISPIQSVASGINEFGIAGAEQVISAIDNGVPIVAIAVIYRETPEALTSKKSLNITEPKDLVGKTVGVVYGDDENLYRLMLKKNGIDESSINEVPALTGVSQILTDKVDAKMAYEMNDAVLLELEGEVQIGAKIIRKALEEPLRQIAINAGLEGAVITERVINADPEVGFDALNERYVNMIEVGIVDPTKVTRSALQNAASIAGVFLTTEAAVFGKFMALKQP